MYPYSSKKPKWQKSSSIQFSESTWALLKKFERIIDNTWEECINLGIETIEDLSIHDYDLYADTFLAFAALHLQFQDTGVACALAIYRFKDISEDIMDCIVSLFISDNCEYVEKNMQESLNFRLAEYYHESYDARIHNYNHPLSSEKINQVTA